jgi:uncharacterized protein (TIGR02001 family)
MLTLSRPVLRGLLAASLGAAASSTAVAQLGGSIGVTSDYVLRGVTQSDGEPAVQADAHWNFPAGWSAGLWGSQVELAPQSDTWELDGYLQWNGALSSDLDMGATVTHYSYPSDPRPVSYEYDELSLSLLWRDQIRVVASWTPRLNLYSYSDGLARDREVYTLEASWHRDLPDRLDLTAGVGFYDPQGLEYASYTYGDAALGWKYGHWRVNLAWVWVQDTGHRQYSSGPAGGPWVGTVAWTF